MTPDTLDERAEGSGEVFMDAEQWLQWARSHVVSALTETAKRPDSVAAIQRIGHILGGIDEAITQESNVHRSLSGQQCPASMTAEDQCPGCREIRLERWEHDLRGDNSMLICSLCGWRCRE